MTQLYLSSGEKFSGVRFGANVDIGGEVVFTTGMTGYLETLTDPSYYGQIVVFTFPLIGNYGVFDPKQIAEAVDATYESQRIWVKGVVLTEWSEEFSHCQAFKDFSTWCKENNVPILAGVDTRAVTQTLREHGCIMGAIADQEPSSFEDPLAGRYVPEVSPKEVTRLEPDNANGKVVAFVDCGAKNGIFRNFLKRGITILRYPFDVDPFASGENFDGIFFSNGPGDPETVTETITTMETALGKDLPIFGICLGNQIMGLGAGGKTEKMKYGHRGVNQPCQEIETGHCIVTTQNHGYVVNADSLPGDFEPWFINLNDQSLEGIKHKTKPIFAVQFHPEACAGPEDAEYLFDKFIAEL